MEETVPKYKPIVLEETFNAGIVDVTLDRDDEMMWLRHIEGSTMKIPYSRVPELVQFLVWAMRERMEAQADAAE